MKPVVAMAWRKSFHGVSPGLDVSSRLKKSMRKTLRAWVSTAKLDYESAWAPPAGADYSVVAAGMPLVLTLDFGGRGRGLAARGMEAEVRN